MSKAELEQLEREAEQARSRLLGGLERLRSNDQLAEIKQRVTTDMTQAKSELMGTAKGAVRERADGAMGEIKARIAANPAAALAIGAGIAWRLYRHPPVTSLLVGAGLMSLLRTDPDRPGMGADMAARAADFAGSARHRVEDWRGSRSGSQGSESSDASVGEKIGAFAETARERVTEFASEASHNARDAMHDVARAADRWTASGRRAVSGAIPDNDRDRVLMGAAAFAIAAAVGIAAQRRANDAQTAVDVRRVRPPVYRSAEIVRVRRLRRGPGHPDGWRGGSAISS